MTPADALAQVRAAGVEVAIDGGELRLRAPPGVLTHERLDWLRAHRDVLVEALRPADGDRGLDFYRRLFEGEAPRALVLSLEPADVRHAVDRGLVAAAVAAASVLLAYRKPGVAGALIAVPREKYDGLAALKVFHETTEAT